MSNTELHIGLILPDVLGTYGDDGNAIVLRQRARLRGINAEIHSIRLGDPVPESLDVYTLGGGEDTAQLLAAEHLIADGGLAKAAAAGRPIFGVCAGLQVLGESFHAGGKIVPGVGLLEARTSQLKERMIGEITAKPFQPPESAIAEANAEVGNLSGAVTGVSVTQELSDTLTGFANHMGATILGGDAQPLGFVVKGTGNTDATGATSAGISADSVEKQCSYEGAMQGSVIATYMHGPALARNPELADVLLAKAMGTTVAALPEWGAHQLTGTSASSDTSLGNQLTMEIAKLRKERLS